MKKKNGFTLVELLVVISIVGLLSSVVFSGLQSARVKARDTKRMSDLRQIRMALELYYDSNGTYPAVTGWVYSTDTSWNTLQTALQNYLPVLPKDPINNNSGPWNTGYYSYAYGVNTASYPGKYDLVAQLENTSSPYKCSSKIWKYHTAGEENAWCGTLGHSSYLYADH